MKAKLMLDIVAFICAILAGVLFFVTEPINSHAGTWAFIAAVWILQVILTLDIDK